MLSTLLQGCWLHTTARHLLGEGRVCLPATHGSQHCIGTSATGMYDDMIKSVHCSQLAILQGKGHTFAGGRLHPAADPICEPFVFQYPVLQASKRNNGNVRGRAASGFH